MADFHLDHDVTTHVAEPLRGFGHNVTVAGAVGTAPYGDHEQFLFAVQRQSIIVTHNIKDFTLLHSAWRLWSRFWGIYHLHPGMTIAPQQRWTAEQLAAELHGIVTGGFELEDRALDWKPSRGWGYVQTLSLLPGFENIV